MAQLDGYLTAEIFSVPLAGTPLFRANSIGVEDALTWIILADRQVGQDEFRTIYTADSWEGFLADVRMWQQAKQRARPA